MLHRYSHPCKSDVSIAEQVCRCLSSFKTPSAHCKNMQYDISSGLLPDIHATVFFRGVPNNLMTHLPKLAVSGDVSRYSRH